LGTIGHDWKGSILGVNCSWIGSSVELPQKGAEKALVGVL
jgi:hypothetical protein